MSIGEFESNLKKVERAAGGRFKTMKALLRDEVERGIHGANAKLKDESAAMGLLWVRRGLGFWAELFELPDAELARSLKAAVLKAYEPTVAPFHGWVARRGYLYCAGSAPDWVALSPSLAPVLGARSTTTSACGCACCGCSTTGCARSARSSASRTSARPYEPSR